MAVLVTLWGARLTFNFARKGGYTGVEDYRWAVLRARMTPWQFQLFNLFFIVLYQNALLVLITLPGANRARAPRRPFGPLDVVLAVALPRLRCSARRSPTSSSGTSTRSRRRRSPRAASRRRASCSPGSGASRVTRTSSSSRRSGGLLFLFGAVAAGSLLQWTVAGAVLLTAAVHRVDDLHREHHRGRSTRSTPTTRRGCRRSCRGSRRRRIGSRGVSARGFRDFVWAG